MKGESGFSLLEVVISLAALTLISGFILQMFIASLYLNRKAYNLDMASNAAAQALETFKGEDVTGGADTVTQYFDADWSQITVEKPGTNEFTQDVNLILPDSVKFVLVISVTEDNAHENEVYEVFDSNGGYIIKAEQAGAYRLDAGVYEIDENDEQVKIAGLSTRKYLRTG